MAVLCGYLFGQRDGMVVGLSAGFFRDMLAGRTLGLGMLILMYAGIIASVAFRQLFRRNVALGIVQVFMATIAYEVLMSGFSFILPILPDVSISIDLLFRQLLDRLPGALLINVLASIPLMLLLYFFGPYSRGAYRDVKDESIVGENYGR
jgi:rod shape-determining protein MreD